MKPVLILLIGLFLAFGASAQDATQTVDVVFLKNGKRQVGEIISYEQGRQLVLHERGGDVVTIPDSKILKILQGVTMENADLKAEKEKEAVEDLPPPVLQKSGIYNTSMLAFAMGSGTSSNLALGAGLSNVTGYQLSPALGIGLGFGLDNYARRGETLYPIFVEVRTFFPLRKKPWAYYAAVAGGYGMAFKREKIGVLEAEGGFMLHPHIGYRTATREGVDVNIDVGVKFQKAKFSHELFNNDLAVRDLVFQRLTVRVGLSLWK